VRILVPLLAVLLLGCSTTRAPQPRFVPGPLEQLEASSQPSATPATVAPLSAEGPVVVGPRGHALNIAASLHRVFQALGIASEIRCEPQHLEAERRQIQIRFPTGLSESQQEDVRLLLGLLRREVATL
jgi:hypothetical protein